MNADYTRIAHRRTVWAELQRVLLDRYMSSEQPAKEQIICEEVPFAQKEVSQEALMEVLEHIEQLQNDERLHMSQYEFRRRDVRPAKQENQEARAQEHRPKPGKKKPKRKPGEATPSAGGADGSEGGATG